MSASNIYATSFFVRLHSKHKRYNKERGDQFMLFCISLFFMMYGRVVYNSNVNFSFLQYISVQTDRILNQTAPYDGHKLFSNCGSQLPVCVLVVGAVYISQFLPYDHSLMVNRSQIDVNTKLINGKTYYKFIGNITKEQQICYKQDLHCFFQISIVVRSSLRKTIISVKMSFGFYSISSAFHSQSMYKSNVAYRIDLFLLTKLFTQFLHHGRFLFHFCFISLCGITFSCDSLFCNALFASVVS